MRPFYVLVREVVVALQEMLVEVSLAADVTNDPGSTLQRLVMNLGDVKLQSRLL